ncbi:hypothetical protein LWI29_032962 [Acer saccharum]|uniref:Uncharacterized protein n=1 Tax=Acer saccharum TaxID=4024 RepID=A0AA39TAK0_ACESA|nr:hypothetical protein LWI29_032962 [Acer saccharum]
MVSAELRSTGGEHLGNVTGQLDVEEDTFEEEMPEEERGGLAEELEEVVVREENPPKTVKIGSTVAPEHKAVLQKVLRDYNDRWRPKPLIYCGGEALASLFAATKMEETPPSDDLVVQSPPSMGFDVVGDCY